MESGKADYNTLFAQETIYELLRDGGIWADI